MMIIYHYMWFYILCDKLFHEYGLFYYWVLYYETSIVEDSTQTSIQ